MKYILILCLCLGMVGNCWSGIVSLEDLFPEDLQEFRERQEKIYKAMPGYIEDDISADDCAIYDGAIPILYGGVFSVGMAFTLQVVAQKEAQPSHAAIIMSSEAVFAVLGGWLILSETLTIRGIIGCALMLVGMLCSKSSGEILKGPLTTGSSKLPEP